MKVIKISDSQYFNTESIVSITLKEDVELYGKIVKGMSYIIEYTTHKAVVDQKYNKVIDRFIIENEVTYNT